MYRCAHCFAELSEVDGEMERCALHPDGQIERVEDADKEPSQI
jgi:hypothetical protein